MRIEDLEDEHLPLLEGVEFRIADVLETRGNSGRSIPEMVKDAIGRSHEAWIAFDDEDQLVAVGGYAYDLEAEIAIPWIVGTELIKKHILTITRLARKQIKLFQERGAKGLANFVWEFNLPAIAWLERLGFSFMPNTFEGESDPNFHYKVFYMKLEEPKINV